MIRKVVSLFSLEKEEIGIREVSTLLGMYPSRVHRLLSALETCGFLEKSENRKYRLGEAFLELGALYPIHFPLRKIVRPHAEELALKFKTNVQVAIFSRREVPSAIIVDRVVNFQSPSLIQRISYNIPLHCSAIGKCLLAFMPPENRRVTLQKITLTKYTPNTITDIRLLKKELESIIESGVAFDRGEMHANIYCVSTPLFKNEKLAGAMSLTDTYEVINEGNFGIIANALKEKTEFISRQL